MLKKVSTCLKNIFINKTASLFSEVIYMRYVQVITIFFGIRKYYRFTNLRKFSSKFEPLYPLFSIDIRNKTIMFQSGVRLNRFMKGFEHAGWRMYERYEIDKLIGPESPNCIIDIGANIGEFSFFVNQKFGGEIKIFAIDPDPIAYECLENNLEATNISLCQVALTDKPGNKTFYLKTASADSSFEKPEGQSNEYVVLAITLDEFFKTRRIEGKILLKMDAEGHEPEILLGALSALKKIKWVAIDSGAERGGTTTVQRNLEILSSCGFDQIFNTKNNIVLASRR